MTLTKIGHAAFNAAEEIADTLDGPDFRLGIEELFKRLAHHVRPLAFQPPGRAFQFFGQVR